VVGIVVSNPDESFVEDVPETASDMEQYVKG
jgi:hypothetical protein